jgi:phosphomannomutase/phosphoglucomutase
VHIFFADRYIGYDDAIYASLRLLEMVSKDTRSVSEMLADVPKTYSTPELRVDCPDEKKFDVVNAVKDYFVKNGYRLVDVDGVRVIFDDGWGLVRPSNTQPVIVLRFEATTEARLKEIRDLVEGKLKEYL